MIINRKNRKAVVDGGTTLPSDISLGDFAQAMREMDLSTVPPERRGYAIRAHVLKIASRHLDDRQLRQEIAVSHFDHLVQNALANA